MSDRPDVDAVTDAHARAFLDDDRHGASIGTLQFARIFLRHLEASGWTVTQATSSFRCPRCQRVSYNPNDLQQGYCGACHEHTCDHRRCCSEHDFHTMPHMGCILR